MWGIRSIQQIKRSIISAFCVITVFSPVTAMALTPIETPSQKTNSYGLEATKSQPPPTRGATISTPNGGAFSTSPITVSGLCPDDVIVQIYNNGVMVGAAECKNGSFNLQVGLFNGLNELTAGVFDNLGQPGPESNKVTVTYNNVNVTAFGSLITLTSAYGRRAANPGDTLSWPLQLSGGRGPYAFSIDWGDGQPAQLKSQASSGVVNIDHVYKQAGVYRLTVKVTDADGVSAFIQLVAVANGEVTAAAKAEDKGSTSQTATKVLWLPAAICLALLFPAYWLGGRSKLIALHKKLDKERQAYQEVK